MSFCFISLCKVTVATAYCVKGAKDVSGLNIIRNTENERIMERNIHFITACVLQEKKKTVSLSPCHGVVGKLLFITNRSFHSSYFSTATPQHVLIYPVFVPVLIWLHCCITPYYVFFFSVNRCVVTIF